MRGTMIEKCRECPHKKDHPILGGYFCTLMKPGMIVDKLVRDRLKLIRPERAEEELCSSCTFAARCSNDSSFQPPFFARCREEKNKTNHLADVQEILGDEYDLDRLREIVEADRDGRCEIVPEVMFQVDNSERVYQLNIRKIIYDTGPGNIAFDKDAIGKSIFHTREAAEAALKGRCQNENF